MEECIPQLVDVDLSYSGITCSSSYTFQFNLPYVNVFYQMTLDIQMALFLPDGSLVLFTCMRIP